MDPQALYSCANSSRVSGGQSAAPSWTLFSAGLVGNGLALLLLGLHGVRGRPDGSPPSAFAVLVGGLTVTDLLGKSLVSPMVLATYAQNRSLRALGPGAGHLCPLFAFFMAFFGLASMGQLLAMALECWLSLGHPFFYRRHVTPRRGALVAPAVGTFCGAFCALPLAGVGRFVQYCPGTWCFIQMAASGRASDPGAHSAVAFSALYATLMALLLLATVACNLGSMRCLYGLHRRARRRRGPGTKGAPARPAPTASGALDHLLLLAVMTVLFTVCSLPFIARAYVRAFVPSSKMTNATLEESMDLTALRFLSVNSIIDPWVFIIFRTSVFRSFFHKFFRRPLAKRNWWCCRSAAPEPAL
ncbi:prostaglandin D2 receptor [Ornithorhynchus anatinus]|uniref:prostaglandin D2 receptor n=1 Tax=Ornithorhynchus anatinus TaxID=9258 RepID=UPI0010A7E3D6|nr:prostaglandin D2 receptor [Ornithorhynchus anatinus]